MNDKVIGILGGMGPEATVNLFNKIVKATPVSCDQDHFRIVIDNNPKIPDRTKAILGLGNSPVPEIVKTGLNLEKMGADFIGIPCITSHYFLEEIQAQLNIPVVNAIAELNHFIERTYPNVRKIGVLCTTGTRNTAIYNKYMTHFELVYPSDGEQEKVMEAIYGEHGIKRGHKEGQLIDNLSSAASELMANGVELLIAGCTELGLVLTKDFFAVPTLDPMDVLAEALISK